ncbi:Nuclear RNA export factor, variant 3 [Schistosoma haematobium]|nr:Nuclear RNA export factor, variant 3 [Schistosoma haematobium]KAH9592138.1 Nuclear RNA export factor, variant 3 [Schistosoma haematobium]
MPHGNHRNKSNHYRWRSHGENDRRIDTSDEYLRRREHGGKFSSGRKSIISGNNVDMLKRAMNMNLIGGSAASVVTAQNSGLAPGEVWVRITIVHGANHPMMDLQQLVTTIVGTQLRFYNTCVEGRNALMHAKIRQKDVQSYRKSLQNLRDPSQGSQLITDITIVPEPRVPSSSDKRNESPNTSPLPETWIEALKQCFVQRYQPTTRSLDLSSLHTDPVLLSQGLYLPLNKQAVVHTLITILKQNQAQLAVLNLSNNRLTHLNAFSPLSSTSAGFIPVSIERIDLSSNPLSSIPVLSGLRDIVGLVELDLTETPLMSKFNPNDKSFAA